MKALTQILQRLSDEPTAEPAAGKLIRRYLALVADFESESEKAVHTMKLAEALAQGAPREAIRYAHMVYKADVTRLDALELVAVCLERLQRVGKAEVLRNEIARLRALQAVSVHPGDDRPVMIPPPAPPIAKKRGDEAGEGQRRIALPSMRKPLEFATESEPLSRMAEIAVLDVLGSEPMNEDPRDEQEFRKAAPGSFAEDLPINEMQELDLFGAVSASSAVIPDPVVPAMEVDRVVPARRDVIVSEEQASPRVVARKGKSSPRRKRGRREGASDVSRPSPVTPLPEPDASPVMQIRADPDDEVSGLFAAAVEAEAREAAQSLAPSEPEIDSTSRDAAASGSVPAAQLFDHFWQQGFFREAGDVLAQTEAQHRDAHWWKARHAVLDHAASSHSKSAGAKGLPAQGFDLVLKAGVTPRQASHSAEKVGGDFWTEIAAELAAAARRSASAEGMQTQGAKVDSGSTPPQSGPSRLELSSRPAELPDALRARLAAAAAENPAMAQQLIEAVWGSAPDPRASQLLAHTGLELSTPGLWRIHLAGLAAGSAPQSVLAVIRSGLEKMPSLAYARVAWPFVSAALARLEFRVPVWRDDDGVPALRKILAQQPEPTFRSVIAD